jgi:hypothetical protein
MILNEIKPTAPPHGYTVNGEHAYYRASALALALRSEGTPKITNINGFEYSIQELKNNIIGYEDSNK